MSRAREPDASAAAATDRPRGACYASPAVVAYRDAVGTWPPVVHAEAVARRFAEAAPDELTAWAEHVTTYAVTPTRNARNVPGIIQTFDEHLRRADAGPRSHSPQGAHDPAAGRGARRGPSGEPARRNARERANQLSARDLIDGAGDALAILRADPDLRGDASGRGG